MTKRIVALEITSAYIKAAQISSPWTSNAQIERLGEVTLKEGWSERDDVINDDEVSDALDKLWDEVGFTTKDIIVGLGNKRIMIRDYETDYDSIENIRKNLVFEVGEALPIPPEEAIIDFYPIKLNEEDAKRVKGLLVATSLEQTERLCNFLLENKFKVQGVLLTALSIAGLTAIGKKADHYVIVNISNKTSEFIIVRDSAPVMVRVLGHGLSNKEDELEVLKNDILMTLDYYNQQYDQPLKRVYLTGEGDLAQLAKQLKESGIEQQIGKFVPTLNTHPAISEIDQSSYYGVISLGWGS